MNRDRASRIPVRLLVAVLASVTLLLLGRLAGPRAHAFLATVAFFAAVVLPLWSTTTAFYVADRRILRRDPPFRQERGDSFVWAFGVCLCEVAGFFVGLGAGTMAYEQILGTTRRFGDPALAALGLVTAHAAGSWIAWFGFRREAAAGRAIGAAIAVAAVPLVTLVAWAFVSDWALGPRW